MCDASGEQTCLDCLGEGTAAPPAAGAPALHTWEHE
jgi:hypothetical protein